MNGDNVFNYESLDKFLPVPMYYQIKQMILEAIKNETLSVGDMIPSEMEFCEFCNVSRPTVRQALSELVSEGYLTRLKGKGTYVSRPKIQATFLNRLLSFNEEMRERGLAPSTKVLALKVVTGCTEACKILNLPINGKVILLERVRYANRDPLVYLRTYLPYPEYEKLLDCDFTENSLYKLLERLYDERVERVHRIIEAVNSEKKDVELLEISKSTAVCLVKTVGYNGRDKPIEYSVARYRGDRNQFSVDLYR